MGRILERGKRRLDDGDSDEILVSKLSKRLRQSVATISRDGSLNGVSINPLGTSNTRLSTNLAVDCDQLDEDVRPSQSNSRGDTNYSFEMFCRDLDTDDRYTQRLLDLLVLETRSKALRTRRQEQTQRQIEQAFSSAEDRDREVSRRLDPSLRRYFGSDSRHARTASVVSETRRRNDNNNHNNNNNHNSTMSSESPPNLNDIDDSWSPNHISDRISLGHRLTSSQSTTRIRRSPLRRLPPPVYDSQGNAEEEENPSSEESSPSYYRIFFPYHLDTGRPENFGHGEVTVVDPY